MWVRLRVASSLPDSIHKGRLEIQRGRAFQHQRAFPERKAPSGAQLIVIFWRWFIVTNAKAKIEDMYRDLVEHSHDFICTHDLGGRLLSVNETAARFLGYTVDELIGMDYRDLIVPEYRSGFKAYLREVASRGSAKGLVQIQTRSG